MANGKKIKIKSHKNVSFVTYNEHERFVDSLFEARFVLSQPHDGLIGGPVFVSQQVEALVRQVLQFLHLHLRA